MYIENMIESVPQSVRDESKSAETICGKGYSAAFARHPSMVLCASASVGGRLRHMERAAPNLLWSHQLQSPRRIGFTSDRSRFR